MAADQTGGGEEGGKTTLVPENQISLARGSAEMTVICGRLKDKQGRSGALKHTTETHQGLEGPSFGNVSFHYLLSLWCGHFGKILLKGVEPA